MCFGVRTQKENYAQTFCINMEETKINKSKTGKLERQRGREREGERRRERDRVRK